MSITFVSDTTPYKGHQIITEEALHKPLNSPSMKLPKRQDIMDGIFYLILFFALLSVVVLMQVD